VRCYGDRMAEDRPEVDEWLETTLWSPKFPYNPPRFLPRQRVWARRIRWKAGKWLLDLVFERGLDTSAHAIERHHFHPDRVWYQPSGWNFLPSVVHWAEVRPTDVFVDFGSGKGRVLYQAAQYPFARVIGVEISAELSEAARRNLERSRDRLACTSIELVTADATEFEIPDDMTYAYFYYPFVGDTFHRVIANIVASLDRNPRRLTIIYAVTEMESVILETGRFRRTRTRRIRDVNGVPHRLSVYESAPAALTSLRRAH
jgi:SAM-dependent methyltransferase